MIDTRHAEPDLRTRRRRSPSASASFAYCERLRVAGARLFASLGPGVPIATIRIAAKVHPSAAGTYVTKEDLLADLLSYHGNGLLATVSVAEEKSAGLPPAAALERVITAWLDGVAGAPETHRAWFTCAHILSDETRRMLDLPLRMAFEHVFDLVAAAVPALAARPEAALLFHPLIRHLLYDPHSWPRGPNPEARRAGARRFAGMLIAAAEAEAAGFWPPLGGTEGAADNEPPIVLPYKKARARLRHVLDAALEGTDIAISRRGKIVARVVRAS